MLTNNPKPNEAGDDLGAPAQQGCEDQSGLKGTAPSNTVPSTCTTDSNTKIIRTGIDSLYLSFIGDISVEISRQLDKLKEVARSNDPEMAVSAQLEISGHTFEVSDKGRSVYSYVLRDNWYVIQVSSLDTPRLPLAYVQVSSELLTNKPLSFILDDLSAIMKSFGDFLGVINVSRVDLCADFITDFPLDSIVDRDWVTRSKAISRYSVHRVFSGYSIGLGGNLSARLYNKTLEMETKSPRPYLKLLWKQLGWDGKTDVWRLEFQFKREVLKELQIISADDLKENLAGLWRYATYHWLRLATPATTDKTQTRWSTKSIWETLRMAPWSGKDEFSRANVDMARIPSNRTLFVNGLSGITSYMAREGYVDLEEGVKAFLKEAKDYHDARQDYTNLDFYAYLVNKIREKQRKFNTGFNERTKQTAVEEHFASADTYRRFKDGE